MMKTIGRSRLASVAGVVAMILAFLSLCPCAPAQAAAASGDDHACCGGEAGLTVTSASCCAAHEAPPTQPAAGALGATLLTPSANASVDVVPTPAPLADATRTGALAPSAAPLILRI
jgi:hypothetical protein